jgi:RNA polymerase sigma factor (sigma-70 family)
MATSSPYSTRISLIKRACASSPEKELAWEELIESYNPFIERVLVHLGYRSHDLEDLRQEVGLLLWKGLRTYRVDDPTTRFRAWLSRVIRNAVANQARSARSRPILLEMTEKDSAKDVHAPEIDKIIVKEWQSHIVRLALARLETAFTGKAVEVGRLSLLGRSVPAIAKELGLQEKSVYVLRHRVNRRLTLEIAAIRDELENRG